MPICNGKRPRMHQATTKLIKRGLGRQGCRTLAFQWWCVRKVALAAADGQSREMSRP